MVPREGQRRWLCRVPTLLVVVAVVLVINAEVFFEENFDTEDWVQRWVNSKWRGPHGRGEAFEWTNGTDPIDAELQKGIRTQSDGHYHSVSAKFPVFSNIGRTLVLQYTVKHEKYHYRFCAGGYIKLLGSDFDQDKFGGDTPYNVMFGPDQCHSDHTTLHLIFNFKGANLKKNEKLELDKHEMDAALHLYTMVLHPNNTYSLYVDMIERLHGDMHAHFDFHKEDHPEFVKDVHAYDDIGGVGFELWSPEAGSIFDNILICDDFELARQVWDQKLKHVIWEDKLLVAEAKKAKEEQETKERRERADERERNEDPERRERKRRARERERQRDRDRIDRDDRYGRDDDDDDDDDDELRRVKRKRHVEEDDEDSEDSYRDYIRWKAQRKKDKKSRGADL